MKEAALLLTLSLLAGCDGAGDTPFPNPGTPTETSSFPSPTATVSVSPTPPAVPEEPPPTRGRPAVDCVDGWRTPDRGSRLASEPLKVIRRTISVPGEPVIVDMRYFTGPDSPPSEKGYLASVERWYVKLFSEQDLSFQGRFLVERWEFGSGLSAVAPYDTHGFRSPDWSGFMWNGGDPTRRPYPGLPGRWAGIRYDFVLGGAGLTVPGLPREVRGCLHST